MNVTNASSQFHLLAILHKNDAEKPNVPILPTSAMNGNAFVFAECPASAKCNDSPFYSKL